MKRILLSLVLALGTLFTLVPASVPAATAATPVLFWEDQFSNATVDTTKWNIRDNTYNSNEASCLFGSNVTTSGGALRITVTKGSYTCGSRTSSWASGYIDSINKTPALGVGDEVRIWAKTPITPGDSRGIWPALWLRSNETPSTYQAGEIDSLEAWGAPSDFTDPDHATVHTVHENTDGTGSKAGYVYHWPSGYSGDAGHLYVTKLKSDRIEFYIDSVLVRSVTAASYPWVSKLLASGVQWNLRINVQVCADHPTWCYSPDSSTSFPKVLSLGYVQLYHD